MKSLLKRLFFSSYSCLKSKNKGKKALPMGYKLRIIFEREFKGV